MALIYGEGEEYAALRLKEEIQKRQQASKKADLQDSSGLYWVALNCMGNFADDLQPYCHYLFHKMSASPDERASFNR